MNLEGMKFFEVTEISVNEWHPTPDGSGPPEQVHLWIRLADFEHPLIMRIRSPKTIDELIVSLITHRKGVWG